MNRGHHVIRRQCLAIVEGDALAQLENPLLCAVGRLEAFGDMGLSNILRVDLDERGGKQRFAEMEGKAVGPGCRIKRVGGLAVAYGTLEGSALLGFGAGCGGKHGVCRRGGNANGHGVVHKIAARQLAPAYGLGNLLQFHFKIGHVFSPLVTR